MSKIAKLALAAIFAACFSAASAQAACAIVFGTDWAFAASAPSGWSSTCGPEAPGGSALFLWPTEQPADSQSVFLYVTVSGKEDGTLAAYIAKSQAPFLEANPGARLSRLKPPSLRSFNSYELVSISNSMGGREEIVAYLEAPTAFFTIVITAESKRVLDRHRATYFEVLESVLPMEKH